MPMFSPALFFLLSVADVFKFHFIVFLFKGDGGAVKDRAVGDIALLVGRSAGAAAGGRVRVEGGASGGGEGGDVVLSAGR